MAKSKKFVHHEYPTEGRSREDEVLANRKLDEKRIPTPIVEGTGKKHGGNTSHRGQDEADVIVHEITGGETSLATAENVEDAKAAGQMFTISQRNARKWKALKKQVELLKEGFGSYEKDHDPEKHVKTETKERDQTGFVDGTGKEVETAMSEEEPLEELTDGELTEVEKEPTQETFPTEEEIRKRKHEAAKKKKKEVWDKAIRDNVGLGWTKGIVDEEKKGNWIDDESEAVIRGDYKPQNLNRGKREVRESDLLIEEAEAIKGKRDNTLTDKKTIDSGGRSVEVGSVNEEGDTLEVAQEKRRAERKRKPTGGKRKKLQQELDNLNLAIKAVKELTKIASADPEKVQHTGRSVRVRERKREMPSWKKQYATGGIESKDKPKPDPHGKHGSKGGGAPISSGERSERTPEKARGLRRSRSGREVKQPLTMQGGESEKKESKFGKLRSAVGGLRDRVSNRKREIESKPPYEQSKPKKGRAANTPPTKKAPKDITAKKLTHDKEPPQNQAVVSQAKRQQQVDQAIAQFKQQSGSDDDPTMYKKRQRIRT